MASGMGMEGLGRWGLDLDHLDPCMFVCLLVCSCVCLVCLLACSGWPTHILLTNRLMYVLLWAPS